MHKYLFMYDSLNFFTIFLTLLDYGFVIIEKNHIVCKLTEYFNYVFSPISSYCIIYISIEKCISIKHPSKLFLKRKDVQLIYISCVTAFSFIYYLPIVYFYNAVIKNETNFSDSLEITCDYTNENTHRILFIADLLNCIIIPFIILLICSIILISSVYRMKQRIIEGRRTNNYKFMKKTIRALLSIIAINSIYIATTLPYYIFTFIGDLNNKYETGLYVYSISYSTNFYIILFSNVSFRKELLKFLKIIKFI